MSDDRKYQSNGNSNPLGGFGKSVYDPNPNEYKQTKGYLRKVSEGPRDILTVILSVLGLIIGLIGLFKKDGGR